MRQSFTINGQLPGLNEYTKACRTSPVVGNEMKKKAESAIKYAIAFATVFPVEGVVNLEITWYEPNKRRDHDNICFAKKYILDALVSAKILKGDGWKYVSGFSDLFAVDRDRPRIEVVIKEINGG